GARGPVRDRRVQAANDRIAAVGRADVVVVAVGSRPRHAGTRGAHLDAVAGVAVAARDAVGDGRVLAALHGIAAVGRAAVVVVAVRRRPGRADPGLAVLPAVADRGVGARRAVRDRGVLAAEHRIAAVGGARVVVVAVGRRPGHAGPGLAGLGAVAGVAVAARAAVREGGVLAAADRAPPVGGAGIVVVAVERGPRGAHAGLAGLDAIAGVPVGARVAVREGDVRAHAGAAHVRGARIAVVAVAVHHARPAAGDRRVHAAGDRIA